MAAKWKIPIEVWERIDWNRPAQDIALEMDVSLRTVYRSATAVGKKPKRGYVGRRDAVDWSLVDWSEPSNVKIGKLVNRCRETVRLARKQQAGK